MKAEHWAYIGIGITCLFLLATCDGCEETSDEGTYEYEQNDSRSEDNTSSAPSWIQGTWCCVTPYGNLQVEIIGDHIREIPGDGTSYYGTFHVDGEYIIPETGSHMHYQMDTSNRRLAAGQGYYFTKQ